MTYFLQSLHKNLQRLSSFAFCLKGAPSTRPASIQRVGDEYRQLMTRDVRPPPDQLGRVASYLSERALLQKYGGKGTSAAKVSELLRKKFVIELQDWLLSDPELPSSTGAEKDQSFLDTVGTCIEMGLLRDGTCTIQTYGRLLMVLAERRGLFRGLSEESGSNPFMRNPAYALAAYFRVLQNDYEFQKQLILSLPAEEFSFTTIAAGATELLTRIESQTPASIANRGPREWLRKQITAARKLNERLKAVGWQETRGSAVQTLYRPLESLFLPRLEFLVDIGLLEKAQPDRYVYRRSSKYEVFIQLFAGSLVEAEQRYFSVAAAAYGREVVPVDTAVLLRHLDESYRQFRNMAGYSTILESVLFSNLAVWDMDPWPIVELPDCTSMLNDLAGMNPPLVRLNSDRFRRPFTFRVVEDSNN